MTDPLERSLREALSYQDAQLDPNSIARLRAVDYRPRQHRVGGCRRSAPSGPPAQLR